MCTGVCLDACRAGGLLQQTDLGQGSCFIIGDDIVVCLDACRAGGLLQQTDLGQGSCFIIGEDIVHRLRVEAFRLGSVLEQPSRGSDCNRPTVSR